MPDESTYTDESAWCHITCVWLRMLCGTTVRMRRMQVAILMPICSRDISLASLTELVIPNID